MCCGLHPLDWTESYYESMHRSDEALLDGYRSFVPSMLMRLLPDDAFMRCSGKVFISLTTVGAWGQLTNKIVSEFHSNEDLIAACYASSTIPFVTTRHLITRFRGEVREKNCWGEEGVIVRQQRTEARRC